MKRLQPIILALLVIFLTSIVSVYGTTTYAEYANGLIRQWTGVVTDEDAEFTVLDATNLMRIRGGLVLRVTNGSTDTPLTDLNIYLSNDSAFTNKVETVALISSGSFMTVGYSNCSATMAHSTTCFWSLPGGQPYTYIKVTANVTNEETITAVLTARVYD